MEALGINWINMGIYSVMFGIIFWAIKTKLVPQLDNAMAKRQDEIDKSVLLSKKAEENTKKSEEEKEKMIKVMHIEHKKKMDDILEKANMEAKEILEKAKIKSKEIIKNGEKVVDDERLNLNKELEDTIAMMAKKGLIWTKK